MPEPMAMVLEAFFFTNDELEEALEVALAQPARTKSA